MSEIEKVLKPNVYVFAFHLIGEISGRDNPLWNWGDDFLESFTAKKLKTRLDFSEQSFNLRVDLLPDISLDFETKVSYNHSELEASGFAKPIKIGDSYALWLNVGFPDTCAEEVSPQWLSTFNPENLLGIVTGEDFIGETILITAKLPPQSEAPSRENLQSLADKCRNALLPEKYRPAFNRADVLFGSPIFEYGLIKQTSNYQHLLVWFPDSEASEDKLSIYQQEIVDLFYYRNKIIKAFHNSRQIHRIMFDFYRQVEDNVNCLQQRIDELDGDLTTENLQEFKAELKKLLKTALTYTQGLTKLEDYDNTIAINLNNYDEKLAQIYAKVESDKEEPSILNHFSRKTAPYMRSQIAGDLGYFRHGTNLIDQAIASIRGIVEIEQARSDRTNQLALRKSELGEKNRDDRLQSTVQAIGVGLAAGGIAASSGTDQVFQTVQNHQIPVLMQWHPFVFSFALSFAIALFAAGITWWRTKPKK
ncbi:hypothetical protein [Microcoleus sp. PH2017_30_WIL_O_A]|uniref:hypothetical protein n=1 Tax=Microcoleus sp. PH2017_30_WIL_O_A TaxID=2798840 RepID=UPI001D41F1CC|nr:hypothetical protein [Microcoleus sp. PH2017_30_WIL_O_A]MCC3587916.1 hypothetical protein [Microcoleus sp. PH2017_30_WIL_O_A]